MSDQAWIAVIATESQNIVLNVRIDGNLISPRPPAANRTVRRCVSPGKHIIEIQAITDDRSTIIRRVIDWTEWNRMEVDLSPGSDYIIIVQRMPSVEDSPARSIPTIAMSLPGPRSSRVWPLVPEDIWGYSKDRYTIIQALEEDEEPFIRDAPRVIDNPSDATINLRIEASQNWKRTYTVETEGSTKVGASLKTGPVDVEAEKTLSTKYGVSTEETYTYTEEVSVTVPPRSKVSLTLAWKLRIRKGILRYFDEAGFTLIDVPFSVVTGVTFDQITS
jgi:hypothetical protein